MNWVDQALQPEHPEDCDLCQRVAKMITERAEVGIMPVLLPCGSMVLVGILNFQVN